MRYEKDPNEKDVGHMVGQVVSTLGRTRLGNDVHIKRRAKGIWKRKQAETRTVQLLGVEGRDHVQRVVMHPSMISRRHESRNVLWPLRKPLR